MILNLDIYAYVYCKFKILNQFKCYFTIPQNVPYFMQQ